MIRRFEAPEWAREWTPLLESTQSTRRLRVLLDVDGLGVELTRRQDETALLWRLLHDPGLDRWDYSSSGPPGHLPRLPAGDTGATATPGWISMRRRPNGEATGYPFDATWMEGGTITLSVTSWAELIDPIPRWSPRSRSGDERSATEIEDLGAALMLVAARLLKADLLVTARPVDRGSLAKVGVTIVTPVDALPLVSLYFRTQRRFFGDRYMGPPDIPYVLDRSTFFEAGSRALLPASNRWLTACASAGTDDLAYTAWAAIWRVARTLQYRDEVLRAVNRTHSVEDADRAVDALELCMAMLMGALDATARVGHRVLGLKGTLHGAGWQRDQWLSAINDACPDLGAVVKPDTTPGRVVALVSKLRNTLHSTGLPPMTQRGYRQPAPHHRSIHAQLPRDVASEVRPLVQNLGGLASWGMTERNDGWVNAEPDILLENLLPRVLDVLNRLMIATPVEERLGYVQASDRGDERQPNDAWTRRSAMLQLGVRQLDAGEVPS